MAINVVANNKKAFHDYEIIEKFEAGMVLQGSEVKALRAKRVNIKDSYCRFIKGELFLVNAHISHLDTTNKHYIPDSTTPRKLLLHKKQLDKIYAKSTKEALTIVPLSIYFNEKNRAKASIALAKGKKLHDKRNDLKKKTLDREAAQAMKSRGREY